MLFLLPAAAAALRAHRINEVKSTRDSAKTKEILGKITECARTKQGNLLELCVEAALARATVGEISDAMEEVYCVVLLLLLLFFARV